MEELRSYFRFNLCCRTANSCWLEHGGELGITLRFREAEAAGTFLMASAVGLENLEPTSPKPIAEKTLMVHGWNDEVVPVENAINFARTKFRFTYYQLIIV